MMEDLDASNLESSTIKTHVLKQKTSKELLTVTGDGSRRAVIRSLMKDKCKPAKSDKFRTHKVARSLLFEQLEEFLPKMKQSTKDILQKNAEERNEMDIENIEGCSKVVEMNVLLGQVEGQSSSDEDNSEEGSSVTLSSLKLRKSSCQLESEEATRRNLIAEIGADDEEEELGSKCFPASEESR